MSRGLRISRSQVMRSMSTGISFGVLLALLGGTACTTLQSLEVCGEGLQLHACLSYGYLVGEERIGEPEAEWGRLASWREGEALQLETAEPRLGQREVFLWLIIRAQGQDKAMELHGHLLSVCWVCTEASWIELKSSLRKPHPVPRLGPALSGPPADCGSGRAAR